MNATYFLPGTGCAAYRGTADEAVRFTVAHQLADPELWKRFADVFLENSDTEDNGWRCEFWGKTMRGGCLTYRYTGDDTLYGILRDAVAACVPEKALDVNMKAFDLAAARAAEAACK